MLDFPSFFSELRSAESFEQASFELISRKMKRELQRLRLLCAFARIARRRVFLYAHAGQRTAVSGGSELHSLIVSAPRRLIQLRDDGFAHQKHRRRCPRLLARDCKPHTYRAHATHQQIKEDDDRAESELALSEFRSPVCVSLLAQTVYATTGPPTGKKKGGWWKCAEAVIASSRLSAATRASDSQRE